MNTSFWVQITLDPALIEELDEASVKQVCEEIEGNVAGVVKVIPAHPDTYVGD